MPTKEAQAPGLELIALEVETRGEVIASNVDEFREMVQVAIGAINREPATDEEFGQAEVDVKALKDAEAAVKDAKQKALADAEDLQALFGTLDETSEEIRSARLDLERLVKAKKQEVREKIIEAALADLADDLGVVTRGFRPEIESAIKGKRTLASIDKAVTVAGKVISRRVKEAKEAIDEFEEAYGRELIMDRAQLELRTADQVRAELQRRFDLAAAEAEKRKLKEEAEKAKAELVEKAAETKREAAPVAKPPKIGKIPVGKGAAVEEWGQFEQQVRAAFHPIKDARAALQDPANIARAEAFALAVGAAWKEATA